MGGQKKDVPQGQVEKHSFASALLKNTRDLWIYTPPGHSNTAMPYALLLVFDGDTYINVVPTPATLDNLLVDKRVPPMVAVIIGNARDARSTELPCNPQFADFLSGELIPWSRLGDRVTADSPRLTPLIVIRTCSAMCCHNRAPTGGPLR